MPEGLTLESRAGMEKPGLSPYLFSVGLGRSFVNLTGSWTLYQGFGWVVASYLLVSIPWKRLALNWTILHASRQSSLPAGGESGRLLGLFLLLRALAVVLESLAAISAVFVPYYFQAEAAVTGAAAVAACTGARWPIWLKFKEGSSCPAVIAALLVAAYPALAGFLAVWILVRLLRESSTAATLGAVAVLPVLLGVTTHSWWYTAAGLAVSAIYLSVEFTLPTWLRSIQHPQA